MNYKSSGEACKHFKITKTTLKNWKDEGKIAFKAHSAKKVEYDIDSVSSRVDAASAEPRMNVVYARVSTKNQTSDLQAQVKMITGFMVSRGVVPDQIFEEVASGMDEDRESLHDLVQLVIENKVEKVYITSKDRLARFGYGYFKNIFSKFETEIVVINATREEDFPTELTRDLVSVIDQFSVKMDTSQRKELKETTKSLEKYCQK